MVRIVINEGRGLENHADPHGKLGQLAAAPQILGVPRFSREACALVNTYLPYFLNHVRRKGTTSIEKYTIASLERAL